mgnify:CR=1 FL=1
MKNKITLTASRWHISERDFLAQVLELAKIYHWRSAHFRHALQREGKYITPVQGDGVGFPDLVLVRLNEDGTARLCFLELKREGNKPSPTQKEWLDMLDKVPGVIAKCVSPSDWDFIVLTLQG